MLVVLLCVLDVKGSRGIQEACVGGQLDASECSGDFVKEDEEMKEVNLCFL